ncbi:DNA/RNA nuclease SfsA [Geomonas subterranea]|uniref:Sugar fermentation stimulation protein homolog n=1 Tax=Geomonas subterranea TaxID=2847989 RepID=A0ABX8LNC8_9BACT|nr:MULTISPECIES: DNA/RNA nuclease SfsA [Geomonas]QXE92215.1 DNA/RNA nuclease SfsA [Geomonas subterranea]QXM09686.1 DNA/RNA nuclease SfsA [Geomonas subterranea]
MKLPQPLYQGTLIRRYQRFLADVELDDGTVVTAHTPNTGSMMGCALPGNRVLLSVSANPGRKYPHSWELVQADGVWVGINTMLPNLLAREAILDGTISELSGYDTIRMEVPYGTGSRIDLLLSGERGLCYVETKNVTLVRERCALFPDAVSARGQKHLRELMEMVRQGHRAVNLFVVQRGDGDALSPADAIDPAYGSTLREAARAGVELLAYQASVTRSEVRLSHRVPVLL